MCRDSLVVKVIEMLKFSYLDKEITSAETRQVFKSHLLQLFEEGADYYNQLLRDLGEIYCPDIDRFYDVLEPRDLDETGRCSGCMFSAGRAI